MSMRQQAVPPIYKGKGSKLDVSKYRLISLTNAFFTNKKEKLVRKRIVEHLEANNLIFTSQSGFRSGRSTLSQLLRSQIKHVESINSRSCIDGIYTDLSKAFGSISNAKLIMNYTLMV